jgi:hypothetical protein
MQLCHSSQSYLVTGRNITSYESQSSCVFLYSVVKTRMQQGGGLYRNSLDCLVSTVQNEGVLAFWKGSSPRVARLTVGLQRNGLE